MVGSREKPQATRVLGALMRESGGWAFCACGSPCCSICGVLLARGALGRKTRALDTLPRPARTNGLDTLAPASTLVVVGGGGRVGGRAATDGAGITAVFPASNRLAAAVRLTAPLATPGAGTLCLLIVEAATAGGALAGPLGARTLGRTKDGSSSLGCSRGATLGAPAGGATSAGGSMKVAFAALGAPPGRPSGTLTFTGADARSWRREAAGGSRRLWRVARVMPMGLDLRGATNKVALAAAEAGAFMRVLAVVLVGGTGRANGASATTAAVGNSPEAKAPPDGLQERSVSPGSTVRGKARLSPNNGDSSVEMMNDPWLGCNGES